MRRKESHGASCPIVKTPRELDGTRRPAPNPEAGIAFLPKSSGGSELRF